MNKNEILKQLETVFSETRIAAEAMSPEAFFYKTAPEKWSTAEELQHLSLTYMPFNKLIGRPAILLRRWGKSPAPSRDPETFQRDYVAAREGKPWKTFPPFVPRSKDEGADYVSLHASVGVDKLQAFYAHSGGDMSRLRDSLLLDGNSAVVVEEFNRQTQLLLEAAQKQTEEQMDECRLPLPYIGLVTVREGLYFTLSHTKHHLGSIHMQANGVYY